MKRGFIILAVLTYCLPAFSQQQFNLSLVQSGVTAAPAVHSGAYGTYNHRWFFIGGRTNGLHGFEPPFAFPTLKINDQIYVVDPVSNASWSASTASLPDSIREAINSSSMEFYLADSMLYMVGGYDWKDALQNFITWPTLTAVNVKGLTNAVINNLPINSYFRQITDSTLAICGAHLQKLDSTYYLVFGHRFDGTYNSTDSGGFYVQHYSYEIRKFMIADDGTNLSVYNYTAIRDTNNFRRRDFNLLRFIDPVRGEGLLAFSGVFQPLHNLPYLNCIEIYRDTVIVRNDFNQNLSQYHSATLALFDSAAFLQHNLFFGGMSMYYFDTLTNNRVTDSMIPFVRTISTVTRDVNMNYQEYNAGIRMPDLLGTNASFFPDDSVALMRNYYIHLNKLPHRQRLGYIVGGIRSPDLNISLTDASVSTANQMVYEVWLDTAGTIITRLNVVNNEVLNFFCYPNPAHNTAAVEFELNSPQTVQLEIQDLQGKLIQEVCNHTFDAGKQKLILNTSAYAPGVYNCVITVNKNRKVMRLQKQ